MLTDDRILTVNENSLLQFQNELNNELYTILSFWQDKAIDEEQGGFFGSVDNDNLPWKTAAKGLVLNSRICWTFSAAYAYTGKPEHLQIAKRAFRYIVDHFIDKEFGGVFWSVDFEGKMLDGKKQIYGLAFCLYGMAEYFKVSNDILALQIAKDLFHANERYGFDHKSGGYIEAFTRNWEEISDLRLSEKDDNERKTTNTHLHIVEAYVNLYKIWPDQELRQKIIGLLLIFEKEIVDKTNGHLRLFFDDNWHSKSTLQSFGHDIEAGWLLQQCAELIREENLIGRFKEIALRLTDAAMEGLDRKDGGLWYEYEPAGSHWIWEKHSWPQAEAMIGFFNAWQITKDERYLVHSMNSWNFVKNHILDNNMGEWFWGVNKDYSLMQKEKAGFWKCPYHNSRACLELVRRIGISH